MADDFSSCDGLDQVSRRNLSADSFYVSLQDFVLTQVVGLPVSCAKSELLAEMLLCGAPGVRLALP
jgi:hypothetical protein